MSVIKAKRKETNFLVITQAVQIRKDVVQYILCDFALEGKLSTMDKYFLEDMRKTILDLVREAFACLEMANSIYITNMTEYEERRIWQDRAIGYYNRLKAEFEFITRGMPHKVNLNKYIRMIDMINSELGLITRWRKSDNKIKAKLLNAQ